MVFLRAYVVGLAEIIGGWRMKVEANFDSDNWLQISLKPETVKEATQLMQLGMARNAATDKVASFYIGAEMPEVFVSLRPKRDNSGRFIKSSLIPKIK